MKAFGVGSGGETKLKQGAYREFTVKAAMPEGKVIEFKATALLNTDVEVNYYRNSGIWHTVMRIFVN